MRRTLITGIAATLLLSWATTAAVAANDGEADGEESGGKLMLVLDSSGSMREPTGGGQTRIEAAKESLGTVIDDLPDTLEVGLRIFGSKDFTDAERKACQDTRRVVDLGNGNQEALREAVDGYEPHGATPTGTALTEAGKDLGDAGRRTIVLVSDGEPTCDPDPCEVAEDLAASGVDVRIDVIGFDVDGQARNALQCIAEQGNGSYYDADDAESLTQSLRALTTRADRPFALEGTDVEGAGTASQAPELSQGQYLDTVPEADQDRFYRIPRTTPNSTIHVGLIHRGEDGSLGSGVGAHLLDESGSGAACQYNSTHEVTWHERNPLQMVAVSSWRDDTDHACNTADSVVLKLEKGSGEVGGLPMEIAVYEEPPLADPTGQGLLPSSDEPPAWNTLEPGEPVEDVVAGTSIANAPILEDGSYSFDVNSGESMVVGIPLDWGQDLQAQVDADLSTDLVTRGGLAAKTQVNIIGPMRSTSEKRFTEGGRPDDWTPTQFGNPYQDRISDEPKAHRDGAQSLTVGYLNRDQSQRSINTASLAGVHYVKVTMDAEEEGLNLPFTLTLQRNEQAGDGTPEYADVDGLAAPQADSPLVTVAGVAGLDDRAGSDGAADDDSESTDAGQGGLGLSLPLLPIALGAGGVLLLTVAVLLIARRLRH